MTHFLGITVLPEYFQVEGIDRVIDICKRGGATAIATSPYVMREVSEGLGQREPPIDAGAGKVRLLERPLWGKRELWVETTPSYEPNIELYQSTTYQPPVVTPWSKTDNALTDEIIDACHDAGLELYFQIQAAIPPGYRVQFGGPKDVDAPRLPDGSIPQGRVAQNASLSSEDVLNYQEALITDLLQRFPAIDGLRLDWPEYPPYRLDSIFVDFSEHAEAIASIHKIPFTEIRTTVKKLYNLINGGLSNADLASLAGGESLGEWLESRGIDLNDLRKWLELKTLSVRNLLDSAKSVVNAVASHPCKLIAHAFPPPWSTLSGMDFSFLKSSCDGFAVKLYTMHWSMMIRYYLDQLIETNSGLDEALLVKTLFEAFGISDDPAPITIADVTYPGPEELHLNGPVRQTNKIKDALQSADPLPVYALIHGYGTVDDFLMRFETAFTAAGNRAWLNRYGYLGNAKLDAIGQIVRAKTD